MEQIAEDCDSDCPGPSDMSRNSHVSQMSDSDNDEGHSQSSDSDNAAVSITP